jgi:hypothetical protein
VETSNHFKNGAIPKSHMSRKILKANAMESKKKKTQQSSLSDEVKKLIDQRISKLPKYGIERVSSEETDYEQDTSFISELMTSVYERHKSEIYDKTDVAETAAQPEEKVRDFGVFKTQRQLAKYIVEKLFKSEPGLYTGGVDVNFPKLDDSLYETGPVRTFPLPYECRIFAPPYEVSILKDGGEPDFRFSASSSSGNLRVTNDSLNLASFSLAGVGFYVSTKKPVLASITPEGTYQWSWYSGTSQPLLQSRGGLGIAIYKDSEPQPTWSREVLLWSESGIIKLDLELFAGKKGNGRIADAASPTFGFGPIPLAPALVNMVPGPRYLVFVYCFQTTINPLIFGSDTFNTNLSIRVPSVTICENPPIVVR